MLFFPFRDAGGQHIQPMIARTNEPHTTQKTSISRKRRGTGMFTFIPDSKVIACFAWKHPSLSLAARYNGGIDERYWQVSIMKPQTTSHSVWTSFYTLNLWGSTVSVNGSTCVVQIIGEQPTSWVELMIPPKHISRRQGDQNEQKACLLLYHLVLFSSPTLMRPQWDDTPMEYLQRV